MSFPLNRVPEGCKHLYGALFSVPFAAIRTPDVEPSEEAKGYKFQNPRLLTESGQSDLLDKRNSAELRESIRNRTLLNPLVCRWVQEGENYFPQLVGGDRRYRALDFLIRKKEIVTDPRRVEMNDKGEWVYTQCSAEEAYATIPCQVFAVNNDLDALALSWAENKGRINLSEGHEVAEVVKLRKFGASDERILEILQRDERWLAETDSLIGALDDDTLNDLLEARIDRGSAIELANIADIEMRGKVRVAANEVAKSTADRKIKKLQRQVEKALDQKEIAEGSAADAEFQEDEEALAVAKTQVDDATQKVKRIVKERDTTTPVATAKVVKKIVNENGGGERPNRILSSKKIQDCVDYLDELIENDGVCEKNNFTCNVLQLKLVRKILNNNILANDDDFAATLKSHLTAKPKD